MGAMPDKRCTFLHVDDQGDDQFLIREVARMTGLPFRIEPFFSRSVIAGVDESREVRLILWVQARIDVHAWRVDIARKAGIVKIASSIFEVEVQKLFVPAFRQHIEAEVAAIQVNAGVTGARHRNSRFEI